MAGGRVLVDEVLPGPDRKTIGQFDRLAMDAALAHEFGVRVPLAQRRVGQAAIRLVKLDLQLAQLPVALFQREPGPSATNT
mgnify:CR=1 FL=1